MDYHPTVQKVAEGGFAIAKAMGAQVTLLHVLSDAMYYSSSVYAPPYSSGGYLATGTLPWDTADSIKKSSQLFLDKSKKHLGDETIQTVLTEGDYADAILETAIDLEADIIVMGSHSHKWLEKIMMGSVTEKVLHHTSIPLFIIPTKKID